MFDIEQQIKTWRQELECAGIGRDEVLAELENHLREQTAQFRKTGLSEEEAFQRAAEQLGDGETLKREFLKVKRHRLWGYTDNPWTLKILALSFILAGIDPLVSGVRVWVGSIAGGNKFAVTPALGLMAAIACLRIVMGVGLLWRRDAWRMVALIWSTLALTGIAASTIYAICFPNGLLIQRGPDPATDFFLGFALPFDLVFGLYLLHLAMIVWGCFILNKRTVRNLFRTAAAS